MKKNIHFKRRQLGQGMTEYIIIVALIAVAAIGTYGFFGQSIRNQVAGLTAEISGKSGKTAIAAAQKSGTDAAKIAKEEYNLSNYNDGADQDGN